MAAPTTSRLRCSFRGHAAWISAACALRPWTTTWSAIDQQRRRQQRRLHSYPPNVQPQPRAVIPSSSRSRPLTTLLATRAGANPHGEVALFTSHPPLLSSDPNHKPDDRKVKLGKTLRILQSHLPTLLQSPLPQEILSPHIALHLFPSTHPHLPTVTGRVAYIAALWSSPIAWNRVPLVGNVRLEILSERMVDGPACYASLPGSRRPEGAVGEQLIVRWRTLGGNGGKLRNWLGFDGGKGKREKKERSAAAAGGDGSAAAADETAVTAAPGPAVTSETEYKAPVGTALPSGSSNKEFTGLFIFDFDSEGRILSHTIEHVQETGQWEKGVGAKVVGLTDWLLGGIKGGDAPCPAFARERWGRRGSP
ncbi:hypothetical protein VTJ83DRAFT_6581 [Remersonia thermophila]|uniref:Chromosome transmission fidelity protein 4 n=1 Tax=Remersonia thermophila TaxID=72144 RepID=A0ABR4D552_9PEZI